MVLVCKYLCSGETSCEGLLWPAEDEVQHKGKEGKHKSGVACNERIRPQVWIHEEDVFDYVTVNSVEHLATGLLD